LYLAIFSAIFAFIIGATVDAQEMGREKFATNFPYTATAYLIGSGTSILAGYIGMRIAVYTNTRTTFNCCIDPHDGFMTAFRGGQVLGFCLVGLALLILHLIIVIFRKTWFQDALQAMYDEDNSQCADRASEGCKQETAELVRRLFELVAGYGLGGSSVALFGRVGGGIYTKAADVGADLVGKTVHDLKEDDVNNPGTIADNVGDNVGDIAGMGADLFGSLAESTCAALVVSSTSFDLIANKESLYFPLSVTAAGVLASFISVCCIHFSRVTVANVQTVLKTQIGLSTLLMTACVVPVIYTLPEEFKFTSATKTGDVWTATPTYTVTRW
jgi:H+-translocating diphosphatase